MVITAAQRRRNLDLDNRCVRVTETVYEFGQLVKGTPKSRASIRTVVLPELIVPELRRHLDTFAGDGPDDFVFVGVKGGQLRRSNFSKPWARALTKAGLSAVHVHDLRHTGNTLTGEAGASLAELMNRMGHSSTPRWEGVPACQGGAGPPAREHARQDGPAGTETVQRRPERRRKPLRRSQIR